MRLGSHTNGTNCEFKMQAVFKAWLGSEDMSYWELEFIDEMTVREVYRRADFLIWKPGNGLINVEAKSNVTETLIEQLDDHAKYCDYSFAYIPDYSMTPRWFKSFLVQRGYGLIVYNYHKNLVTEVLEAHRNTKPDLNLREIVLQRMRLKIKLMSSRLQIDTQQKLEI